MTCSFKAYRLTQNAFLPCRTSVWKQISSSPKHTSLRVISYQRHRLHRLWGFSAQTFFHLAITQLHLFTATHNSFPLKYPAVLLWDCSRGAGWKPFEKRPLPAEALLAWKRLSLWMKASLTRLVRGFPLSHGPRGWVSFYKFTKPAFIFVWWCFFGHALCWFYCWLLLCDYVTGIRFGSNSMWTVEPKAHVKVREIDI